jgi:ABC-type ATPase involved in cell division
VFDLIRDINASGTAVLFATHDLELVRRHPELRVIELDHGTIVFDSAADRPMQDEEY